MNSIFDTKEDYLKFKQHWANYFNTEAQTLERNSYGNKKRKLTGTHFVLYALIRGKDWKMAIQGCSQETLDSIEHDLKSRWFYENQVTKDAFNLTEKQAEAIKNIAAEFPNIERRPETRQKTRLCALNN